MFSGVMAWQDVAQDSEVQKKKKWADAESCLPGRRRINVSTAEVLRQAEGGFGLEGASADKRWLGGDAWFGGVESAVMLKKKTQRRLNLHRQEQHVPVPQGYVGQDIASPSWRAPGRKLGYNEH